MKKKLLKCLTAAILATTLIVGQAPMKRANAVTGSMIGRQSVNIGYVGGWGCNFDTLDVSGLTDLYYAFGEIYHNEEGFDKYPNGLPDPTYTTDKNLIGTIYLDDKGKSDLSQIWKLKQKNPNLRVSLSLGGYCGRGFSDATLTKESRAKTIKSIVEVVNRYGLDGIDIDWEGPVNGGWKTIKARPEDKENYTFFVKELREALGKDKIISATVGSGYSYREEWTEPEKLINYVDYIAIMTYEYAYEGPIYNSPLYSSSKDPIGESWWTYTDADIQAYINKGIPKDQIVLGIPFAGRPPTSLGQPTKASAELLNQLGLCKDGEFFVSYSDEEKILQNENVVKKWDDEAKVPYLVYIDPDTKEEVFLAQYEDKESVKAKSDYAFDNDIRGAMIWEIDYDVNSELVDEISNSFGLKDNKQNHDLNGDGTFDVKDIAEIAKSYNSTKGDKEYNKNHDLNKDRIIDISDLVELANDL